MTKEEIIEMARKANCGHESMDLQWICPDNLEAFAKLVAEKERDECAKLCDESEYPDGIDLAYLIRARGQK